MHNGHKKYSAVIALLLSMVAATSVHAEEKSSEYELDPVVVTAQRYENTELKTPAAMQVYTASQLEATGARTALEALKYSEGIVYHNMLPGGQAYGTMTSKIIIRGVEQGTLVLVDGVPMNLSGRYNLEDIPVADIERIEIIRGGGAVMYGSEATGGVINIIMKKKRQNRAEVSFGTHGQQQHNLSIQADKFGFFSSFGKTGAFDKTSEPATGKTYYYGTSDNEKHEVGWNYQVNDNLRFSHTYTESDYDVLQRSSLTNKLQVDSHYFEKKNLLSLNYSNGGLKSKVYYNRKDVEYDKNTFASKLYEPTDSLESVLGADAQYDKKVGNDRFLLGTDYKREKYEEGYSYYANSVFNAAKSKFQDRSRDIYSVFGQWNHPLSAATDITLSARETWAESNRSDQKKFDQFTPQAQLLHKLDKNTSLYASAGKSFMLPTFKQIFGSGSSILANPDVKPQRGEHYEVGWKRIDGGHAWKVALFNYEIEDYITTQQTTPGVFTTSNQDIRNTGIEISSTCNASKGWHTNWSANFSNPQYNDKQDDNVWKNQYGKIQLTAGVGRHVGDWTTDLSATYLTDREYDNQSIKPMLLTSLNIKKSVGKDREWYLVIDNLLDRQDITTNTTSVYYAMPRSARIGYRIAF